MLSLQIKTAGIVVVIPAASEVCLFQFLPVIGFSVRYGPCHRVQPVPCASLHVMELLLFLLALLGERDVLVHMFFLLDKREFSDSAIPSAGQTPLLYL